jgi:hypothetical protein
MRKPAVFIGFLILTVLLIRSPEPSSAVPAPREDPWPGEYMLINPQSQFGGIGGFGAAPGFGGGLAFGGNGLVGNAGVGGFGGFGGFNAAPPSTVKITREEEGYIFVVSGQRSLYTAGKDGILQRDNGKEKLYLGSLRFASGIQPERPVLLWGGRYYMGAPRQIKW